MSAEPTKRVFMAMGDSSEFLKKPEKNAGTDSSKNKTIRLVLELFEPDEHKFPEFNYKKLVHIEKVNWTIFLLLVVARFAMKGRRRRSKRKESIFRFTLFSAFLAFRGECWNCICHCVDFCYGA